MPIFKASAVVFSEPPHAFTHPSRGEVISEPLLSSLDVSSRCAVGLQSGASSSTSRDKSQEQSCLVATEHKKVHDSVEFQVHTLGCSAVNTYFIKPLRPRLAHVFQTSGVRKTNGQQMRLGGVGVGGLRHTMKEDS